MSNEPIINVYAVSTQEGMFRALAAFAKELRESYPLSVGAGIKQVEGNAVFVKFNSKLGKLLIQVDDPVLEVYGVPSSVEGDREEYNYRLNLQGGTVALTDAQFRSLESECKGKLLSTDSDGTVNLQYPFDSVSRLVDWLNSQTLVLTEDEAYEFMASVRL